jgi:uncharacterized protein (TIGR03118 family)
VNRSVRLLTASAGVALLAVLGAAPAQGAPPALRFTVNIQVSDQASDHPAVLDPLLVNAWGLALGPTSPLWVADNGSGTATVYRGTTTIINTGLVVTMPGTDAAPTGEAFNGTGDFVVTGPLGSGPARFLFVGENGDIDGWSPAADATHAVRAAHVGDAVFKGLALLSTAQGSVLLATDFANGRIDAFDATFHPLDLGGRFHDPGLPKGYSPFNVFLAGGTVYVSYAKQVPGSEDEAHGPGLGVVDAYTDFGAHVHRIATHGTLNAPWGMAIAPAGFGSLTGDLLVGNFGDGRINAFHDGHFAGQLRDTNNRKIFIDGLWALLPGTAASGGVGTLWYSAGPDDENHGRVGQIIPATG